MSTQNWIKMSTRKPTDADLPVEAYDANDENGMVYSIFVRHVPSPALWTDWRKITAADIPAPPKEETQANKDADAFSVFHNSDDGYSGSTAGVWHMAFRAYWHAALAYERAEVAKLLPVIHNAPSLYSGWISAGALDPIRARCGGAK